MRVTSQIRFSLLVSITAFIIYLATLAPSVVTLFDDSLEFQLVTYQLGIAHPTGYPLYTLFGKLFTLLPISNVAFRVNLMSAVCGAITVGLLANLLLHLLAAEKTRKDAVFPSPFVKNPQLSAVLTALIFTLSPIFWLQATIAEVYTLNTIFITLILHLLLTEASTENRKSKILFLLGLSLTHHRTTVLLFPAVGLYFLLTQRQAMVTIGWWLTGLVAGCLPLLLYLYLPLRGHIGSLDGTYRNTLAGFWQQVTASGYGSAFLLDNPFGQERNLLFYVNLLDNQFPLVWLGLVGWGYLVWRRQIITLMVTTAVAITYTLFNLFYNVADIEVFFIPVFLVWAVWWGVGFYGGLEGIFQLSRRLFLAGSPEPVEGDRSRDIIGSRLRWTVMVVVVGSIGGLMVPTVQATLNQLHTRNQWTVHDYGIDILRQPLPKQATIVGILGEMTLIRYFQQTEGLRPDIQTIVADDETLRRQTIDRLLSEEQTVYLTRELPGLGTDYSLNSVGPLIRVSTTLSTALPEAHTPLAQQITPEIALRGYHLSRTPHTGADEPPLRLTLFWHSLDTSPIDLKVSVRLLNEGGDLIAVVDGVPVRFAYPTSQWKIGEIVSDAYDLYSTKPLLDVPHQWLIIWYDPAQQGAEIGRVILPQANWP